MSTSFEDLILRDTAVNRPAAGKPGRLFYDTTNNKLQRDNGSTWDDVEPTIPAGYTDEQAQDAVGGMADTNTLTYTDSTPLLEVKKQMSITADGSGLKLSGDASTPGNNKVYGTDGSGVKGWKADPTGGSLTLQYPALKPGSPTYDFEDASLSGDFTAHSSQGSFATTDCLPQSPLGWVGSALAMHFSAQMGGLYVAHSDADLDFTVGGLQSQSIGSAARMIGIAALDTNGDGIGIVTYSDNNVYIAAITAWNYVSNSDNWAAFGLDNPRHPSMPIWLRLKRVSGTWTGYASVSGKAWDKTFATRADSVTVDKLFFGMLYNTATTYNGILTADYFHMAV